jgi:hypothetical protein
MASILEGMHGAVAEGVATTRAAKLLADRLGLQVPIISGLYKILYGEHYSLMQPGFEARLHVAAEDVCNCCAARRVFRSSSAFNVPDHLKVCTQYSTWSGC